MGVSLGIDLSKLDICFGGFSPTAMGDAIASSERAKASEERIRVRFEAKQHAAELEQLRHSAPRQFTDTSGNLWEYAEIDGKEIQILSCTPSQEVLNIPDRIDSMPVVAVAPHAFTGLSSLTSISMPDTVVSLGGCAFQDCKRLAKIRFSASLSELNPNWFRGCGALERMVLPGCLEEITAGIFSIAGLKYLKIGASTQGIAPGAFEKSRLEVLEIAEGNPFMFTDGTAIYSHDGSVMAALVRPVSEYNVRPGCIALGKKAFSNMDCVRSIGLPESLEAIGPFAFCWTSIEQFHAPPHLKAIGEKAFFNCLNLKSVDLNSGLEEVGSNAFSNTSIESLCLPATVDRLGFPLVSKTQLVFAGEDATFRLEPGSKRLILDKDGALYKRGANGLFLINLADPECTEYSVRPGTVRIEQFAFNGHSHIESVYLPDSVRKIAPGAFRNCRNLRSVHFNEGLESIGDEAFVDTSLKSISLPASLVEVGNIAFITHGAHHGNVHPSLEEVAVHPDNPRFYAKDGMLLERKNERTSRVVLFAGYCNAAEEARQESALQGAGNIAKGAGSEGMPAMDVEIPSEVDEIAPYAFNGATGIRSLRLSDRISTIGIRGLAVESSIRTIRIDLMKPVEGRSTLEINFPETDRGRQQMHLALSASHFVNPEAMFSHYDAAITNASSFDAQSAGRLDPYEQAVRLIERLRDPVFLRPSNEAMCRRVLSNGIVQICVEMAKHDDRRSIDALVDMGFLNQDNILDVIDRVGAVQDASITGYLLEISRKQTGIDAMDFEL